MPSAPADLTLPIILLSLIGGLVGFASGATWVYKALGGRPLFEPEPPRDVPWGQLEMAVCLVIAFGTLIGTGLIYALVRRIGASGPVTATVRPLDLLAVNTLWMASATIGVAALLRLWSGARLADFGLGRGGLGRDVLRGLVACALALPAVYLIQGLCALQWTPTRHPVERAISEDRSGLTAMMGGLVAVLVAPGWEEFFFRGVLLAGLLRVAKPARPEDELGPPSPSPASVWGPNVLVSAFFAALHMEQWPAPIPLFYLSLGLGELFRRSRSIVAPFVMHACFNGVSAAAALVASRMGVGHP